MPTGSGDRDSHGRRANRAARHRHPRRGEPLSGGFVEIGEVAGWIGAEAVAQGEDLAGPMEVEHYASHIASLWESATPVLGAESSAAIGSGVVASLRSSERPSAPVILKGLAAVADPPIGVLAAGAFADREAASSELPAWLSSVGAGEIVGAGRIEDERGADATIVLFDLDWPCGDRGGLSVFIDHRLRGLAKHILVGPSIAACREELERPGQSAFEQLSNGDAAALVWRAVERSEASVGEPVGETYTSLRGFLQAQLRGIGDGLREVERS